MLRNIFCLTITVLTSYNIHAQQFLANNTIAASGDGETKAGSITGTSEKLSGGFISFVPDSLAGSNPAKVTKSWVRLKIWPNPSSGEFTIDPGVSVKGATVIITDENGKAVMQRKIETEEGSALKFQLTEGIYYCTFQKDGTKYKNKVVVTR